MLNNGKIFLTNNNIPYIIEVGEHNANFEVIRKMEMDIYVARQPILSKDMKLFGYELLYRRG